MTEQTIELISQAVERIQTRVDRSIEVIAKPDSKFDVKRSGNLVKRDLGPVGLMGVLAVICAGEFSR